MTCQAHENYKVHFEHKIEQLQAELTKEKKLKEYLINTFRQHKENKWKWSDEDVLYIIRSCIMSDEEFEALKGE